MPEPEPDHRWLQEGRTATRSAGFAAGVAAWHRSSRKSRRTATRSAGFVAGVAGAAVALGVGELIDGVSETIPSLVIAVGEVVTDYAPGEAVAFSIANLGASQKAVLTVGIVVLSLAICGLLGRFAASGRRSIAVGGFALFGLIGGWAAARNPLSPAGASWLVALAAAVLGAATTLFLASRAAALRRHAAAVPADAVDADEADVPEALPEPAGTRRSFFAYAAGAAIAALGLVGLGRSLRGESVAEQARETHSLPSRTPDAVGGGEQLSPAVAESEPTAPATAEQSPDPGDPTPTTTEQPRQPTPATQKPEQPAPTTTQPPRNLAVSDQVARLDTLDDEVAGISPYITPITPRDEFYRIDTALTVPQVDPADWRLKITGMVDHPHELTFDDMLGMDLSDHVVTLSCVSNPVGGHLVGNAIWTGVPLSVLLDRAGVRRSANQVVGRSVDDFTAGFPTGLVYDGRNAILAIGMNDELLPTRHGFPARLIVAGLYGYVSAVKWLDEIRLTTWDGFDGYWVPRGWSKRGPIKTQSRIDVPRRDASLKVGETTSVAGIAWAPTRGIRRVETRIGNENWAPCRLGQALGDESWVQWRREWTPTAAGSHDIQVRATDGTGATQGSLRVSSNPSGAEGHHTITVNVRR